MTGLAVRTWFWGRQRFGLGLLLSAPLFQIPHLSSPRRWLLQTLPAWTGSCGQSALPAAGPHGDRCSARPGPFPSVHVAAETVTVP